MPTYNIQAKLRNDVLSIYVYDTMANLHWRQEFTQISFAGHRLYDIAKELIKAIKEMITGHKNSIAIIVYNQWCYLTICNSNKPSFALRPIDTLPSLAIANTNGNKSTNHSNHTKKLSIPSQPIQSIPPITDKKQKKRKKKVKKQKRLKICLNGAVIDDVITHVYEQELAEEEWYDENEDMFDDDIYYSDPNYLDIAPQFED